MAHNRSTSYGGALFLSSTNAWIDGTQFIDNGATKGGAIYTKLNDLQLLNCDFTLNTASILGPIIAYDGNLGQTVTYSQTNCPTVGPADVVRDPNP